MTTNERERAQLEREENEEQAELALMVVEVVGRDHQGRICQMRGIHEATDAEARAILKKRKAARRDP